MRLAGKVAVITGVGAGGLGGRRGGLRGRGRGWWWGMVIAERAEEVAARIVAAGGRRSGFVRMSLAAGSGGVGGAGAGAFGQVDILMNSAGRSFGDDIREIDDEGDLGIGILMWC
ncbi:MAG: hypothetical protein U0232_04470 [Thermomicrobiales bacterium]